MKEESGERQPESGVVYRGEARVVESTGDAPGPRFKHQSFLYRGRVYVHGGTAIPSSQFADDPLELWSLAVEGEGAGRWERVRTRTVGKELEAVSGHAAVLNGSKYYVFGGSNAEWRASGQLLRLNLETSEWTRLEQKGEVPTAREAAALFFLEKNWLMLYGGLSCSAVEIYNSFHFYNLDTRNWSACDGAYQYQLYPRLDPALALLRDRLYLFGGAYRTNNNEERFLNDFYEIAVAVPARNQAARVQVRRLAGPGAAEGRSGHCLVAVGEHHLALVGGEGAGREGLRFDEVGLAESLWLFDTRCHQWGRLQVHGRHFRPRSMASCLSRSNKLYLFGGLHSYNSVLRDLVEITLDPADLAAPRRLAQPCPQCHERDRFPPATRYVAGGVIEDVAESMEFPFAAVGLLIDNAMNSGASLLKISYIHSYGPQKTRLLKFEDDAKLNWTDQELLDTLTHFNAGQMHMAPGTDKKIKAALTKDAFRREYGYNLKLASLRLGQGFLFISYNDDQSLFRVASFQKSPADSAHSAPRYAIHFYTYHAQERKVGSAEMEAAREWIASHYGDLVQSVLFQRKCRNTVLVMSPRVQEAKEAREAQEGEQAELKADMENGNLLNGPLEKVRQLERLGFFVQECVDVSLRAYITCLYLKNECMKVMLSVRETSTHPVEVQTQAFLEKVDRLCKHKHVLEINPALEFDLKISELYYLYDLRRKLSFFNNGLLIYHKNRLLTRYKYPLGRLLTLKYYKRAHCHNFLRLFGFIELPDHIPVNFLKTTYLHHAMMERLFSRLKLIAKLFKRELGKMAADPDYRRPAPTKLNEEEAQQDRNEVSEPKAPRARKSDAVPREISLRRRKTTQRDSLEGRLKQLLHDPTSENLKEIIRIVETNSANSEDLAYFHRKKHLLLGPNAPLGRPLSCKSLLASKPQEPANSPEKQTQKEEQPVLEKVEKEQEDEEAAKALEAVEEMLGRQEAPIEQQEAIEAEFQQEIQEPIAGNEQIDEQKQSPPEVQASEGIQPEEVAKPEEMAGEVEEQQQGEQDGQHPDNQIPQSHSSHEAEPSPSHLNGTLQN